MNGLTTNRYYSWAAALLVLVAVLYLGRLGLEGELGFPLDDAWIHQTYARNLVRYREFSYIPGLPSAGSTAPLWTMFLAPAYLLSIAPLAWSYVLGMVVLFLLSLGVYQLGCRLYPAHSGWAALAGLTVLLEWHMVWAAFSGMETLLFACGVIWLLERYMAWESVQKEDLRAGHWRLQTPFVLGLLGGMLVLVRPEGLLLIALLAVAGLIARRHRPWRHTLSAVADSAAGFALPVVPYGVFNLLTSNSLFPNTFYAKQVEYATLLELPVWTRLWQVMRPTWVGAQLILLPGAVYALICLLRPCRALPTREDLTRYARLVPALWWVLTWLTYALRLPVDYQHGRYLMPTIPVLMLFGMMGTLAWLRPQSPALWVRVLSRATPWIVTLLLVGFLLLGARAFADDVGIINGEMVSVARWLNQNTPPDALIAVHDIGAIGYFADRRLLDMAGLVTPGMIPLMRDESRLLEFVLAHRADYLVTFPSWYPQMVQDRHLKPVYQTGCPLTLERGGENMAVYEIE